MKWNSITDMNARVLIVAHHPTQLRRLSTIFTAEGFEVTGCVTVGEAVERLADGDFEAAVVDLDPPDLADDHVLNRLANVANVVPLIISTAPGSCDCSKRVINMDAFACVDKEINPKELVSHVYRAVFVHAKRRAGNLEEAVAARTAELRDAKQALEESQRLLVHAERLAAVGGFKGDLRAGTFTFSDGWMRIHGTTSRTLSLAELLVIAHPEDRPVIETAFDDTLMGRGAYDLEYRVIQQQTGEVRWVHARGEVMRDGAGSPAMCFGSVQDITDSKQAEKAAKRQSCFHQDLIDSIPCPVFWKDRGRRYLGCNKAFEEFLGKSRIAIIGKTVFDVAPRQLAATYREMDEALFEQAGAQVYETCVERADGNWRDVVFHKAPFTLPDGSIGGLVGVILDITKRKQAEQAVADNQQRFEQMLDSFPHGIYIVGQDYRVEYMNLPMRREFGDPGERKCHAYFHDLPSPCPWCPNERVFRGEVVQWNWHSAKNDHDYELIGIPLRNTDGTMSKLEIFHDVTDRKRAQAELAQAKNAAEAANRAKNDFLANMSHEIRTPMTAIMGFTELLLAKERSPAEQREYLTIIQRNARNLLGIINDILDLSKIEARKTEVELTDWSPRDAAGEVKTLLDEKAKEKGVGLEIECAETLPAAIQTDPGKLRQVLVNLVGNAIKFTDAGRVRVSVRPIINEHHIPQIQFEVTDTGVGMSAEEMKNLFQPFTQVDMSSTRRFGGTGLGLTISRRLAEMLGGKIEVASEPGKGSTFTLTIDVRRVMKQEERESLIETVRPAVARIPTLPPSRILLAEDVPDMAELIQRILDEVGLRVDVADNGLEACERAAASKAAGEPPYDLILMDIRMPVMDGYEATRRLRRHGWEGPIVALTAHAMCKDRENCLNAGCNDFLSKPVTQQALLSVLQRYLGQDSASYEPLNSVASMNSAPQNALFDGLLDEATTEQLVQEYAATLEGKAATIEIALRQQNLDLLRTLAHELKGVAGMYGFSDVSHKAHSLKELAAKVDDMKQLEEAARELVELCRTSAESGR